MGLVESPAWHSTTSIENKVAHCTRKCSAYGFQPGSSDMKMCVMQSMERSASDARAHMAKAFSDAGRDLQQMNQPPQQTNCTTTGFGNTLNTNCTTW